MNTSDVGLFAGGWLILLGSLYVMNKFEGTRTIVYYILWLGIALDLAVHGVEIQNVLNKLYGSSINPQSLQQEQNTPSK